MKVVVIAYASFFIGLQINNDDAGDDDDDGTRCNYWDNLINTECSLTLA